MELCLQEGLSCNAVAARLGHPSSSLARWIRHARMERGQGGARDQGLLTTEERTELNRLRRENRELRREKDFFRLAAALCHEAAATERFRLIDQLAEHHSVSWLCRQLAMARSGFYAWRQRQVVPGMLAAENALITTEIEAVFQTHRGFHGSPRIQQELLSGDIEN